MQQIEITKVKPYSRNAKKHPDKQVKQIARSIEEFGFNQPIVVDKNNEIIVGHGRYQAALLLGIKKVPVMVASKLTPAQVKAYRLADNKLNESDWDNALVIEELKELDGMDMDITITGFDRDMIIDDDDKDDDIPEKVPARAKLGDIYELGMHRLMCGDATSTEDVGKLMDGAKADMVFTDPPYNVDYSGRGKETSNKILNDHMTEKKFDEFLLNSFLAYKSAVKISAPFYICHSSSSQRAFEDAMNETGLMVKNQIIWNKPVASMGWGDYRWKHEPLFYATYGQKNVQFYGDRSEYTVWNESWNIKKIEKYLKSLAEKHERGGSSVWTIKRDTEYKHPTQKPVELVTTAMRNSSKEEDIVLDLFGGSGTTMIAAEKLLRSCFMMELAPEYVDKIIARWEFFTGQKAKKVK